MILNFKRSISVERQVSVEQISVYCAPTSNEFEGKKLDDKKLSNEKQVIT